MNEKELLKAGYRKYSGDSIDVYFNANVCQHAGRCVKGLPEVFDIKKRPWINLSGADEEAVKRTIDTCPSGGIKYIIKE